MRYFFTLVLFLLLCSIVAKGKGRRHGYDGPARSEAELASRILGCLQNKDTISYYHLFPPFDSLWKMVMHNPDRSPEAQKELNELKEHPTVLINFDPFYNPSIIGRFASMLRKGEDSGLHWDGLVLQRYELKKQNLSMGMEGLQRIAPDRYEGFLFVRDMLSSTTFCITVEEIQKIDGFYYGGQVINVLEASTTDEYLRKNRKEREYYDRLSREPKILKADSIRMADSVKACTDSVRSDSIKMARADLGNVDTPVKDTAKKKNLLLSMNTVEDEPSKTRKEVIDRRYYSGKFDDEIPVKLYIRYMKDPGGKVNNWDALYKFGDMEQYVKLDVSKADGKWLFEEPVATMELELADKVYTGTWTNGGNQTGYDVVLTQKEISQQKLTELDHILETGTWGKTDEQAIEEKREPPPPKKEEDPNDN